MEIIVEEKKLEDFEIIDPNIGEGSFRICNKIYLVFF